MKKIKAIEDQGEKQLRAIQNQKEIKTIKKYACNDKVIPLISKQKEIFHKLVDERLDKINKLDKKLNPDDLTFDELDNASDLISKIREGITKIKKWNKNSKQKTYVKRERKHIA